MRRESSYMPLPKDGDLVFRLFRYVQPKFLKVSGDRPKLPKKIAKQIGSIFSLFTTGPILAQVFGVIVRDVPSALDRFNKIFDSQNFSWRIVSQDKVGSVSIDQINILMDIDALEKYLKIPPEIEIPRLETDKNNIGYLIVKRKRVEIGNEKSKQYKFLAALFSPFLGNHRSVNELFYQIYGREGLSKKEMESKIKFTFGEILKKMRAEKVAKGLQLKADKYGNFSLEAS